MDNKIVRAYNTIPLKMLDWTKDNHKQALMGVITEWAFMVGTKEANTREENIINVKFIITNYGDFTLDEVRNAMNWSLTNMLDVDASCYGRFAPMYIAKILNAYAQKRSDTIRYLIALEREDRQRKDEAKKLQAMPYNVRVEEKRKFLITYMTEMRNKQSPDVAGGLIWKVLERQGVLNETMIDDMAKEYGKRKVNEEIAKERMSGSSKNISKVVQDSRNENSEKRFQKDNLMHRYLSVVESIEGLVSSMSDKVIMGNEK